MTYCYSEFELFSSVNLRLVQWERLYVLHSMGTGQAVATACNVQLHTPKYSYQIRKSHKKNNINHVIGATNFQFKTNKLPI